MSGVSDGELTSIKDLRCPACKLEALFVAKGGYVTCGNPECPNPDYEDALRQLLADTWAEAADDAHHAIIQLNWAKILDEAIKSRPTSWKKDPVWEYRNASDEVLWAFMRAAYDAGIFKDHMKSAAEWYRQYKALRQPADTPAPQEKA